MASRSPTSTRRSVRSGPESEAEFCGFSSRRGSEREPHLDYAAGIEGIYASLGGATGPCPQAVFQKARAWATGHWWLRGFIPVYLSFLNSRLTVGLSGKGNRTWLNAEREAKIGRMVRECLREAVVSTNLLVFWREPKGAEVGQVRHYAPILLRPEQVVYDDTLGLETIRVPVRLSPAQLALLPEPQRRRYATGQVTLDPEQGEQVRVWRDGLTGSGLAWPTLASVFRVLTQSDSMEVGENEYAQAGRLVNRAHVKGHEVRTGPATGTKKHFATKEWGEAVLRSHKGATGLRDSWRNFDQKTVIEWIDPKNYDAAKWATIERRLIAWGGPLARMLEGRSPNPDLAGTLQAQMEDLRAELKRFLEPTLKEAFKVPGELRLRWSNQCFKGQRISAELSKWAVQQGCMSTTTAMADILGEDALEAQELARKRQEREWAEDLQPLVLPNHGKSGGTGGKPALAAPGGRPNAGDEA